MKNELIKLEMIKQSYIKKLTEIENKIKLIQKENTYEQERRIFRTN
jgi:hypothetical protein